MRQGNHIAQYSVMIYAISRETNNNCFMNTNKIFGTKSPLKYQQLLETLEISTF